MNTEQEIKAFIQENTGPDGRGCNCTTEDQCDGGGFCGKFLRAKVFENLRNAEDNMGGHYDKDFWSWPVEDIVADLMAFAADVEDETAEALTPHVQAYLDQRGGPGASAPGSPRD